MKSSPRSITPITTIGGCWSSIAWTNPAQPTGGYLIAVAAIDAGVGERVLVLDEGNGARQILGNVERAGSLGRRRRGRFGRCRLSDYFGLLRA